MSQKQERKFRRALREYMPSHMPDYLKYVITHSNFIDRLVLAWNILRKKV